MFEGKLTKHSIRLYPGQKAMAEELKINISEVCRDALVIKIDEACRLKRLTSETLDERKVRLCKLYDEATERQKAFLTPEAFEAAKKENEVMKQQMLKAEDYYAEHPELRFW